MWFTKRRRAQTTNDYETWIEGGVSPTLNSFDNTGDSRPTVLITFENSYRDGIRIGDGEIIHTMSAKMGTGGNNVPFIATDVEGSEVAATLRGFGHGWQGQHNSTNSIVQGEAMHVRRLTPLECERLMGWPDNHTQPRADGKTNSDTNRYKMCGNGVASPVATWIANQINNI